MAQTSRSSPAIGGAVPTQCIDIHCVAVPGGYHEIDTIEDYHLASREWGKGPGIRD